jgi:RNA polymerase sigma factor (sigma-70 family)
MSTADGIPTGDELERHARWIRRLSGALLRDEGAAEDLVQDAWCAALTHPPEKGRLRPWLREVVHNFARQHHRGKARRAAREAVARAPSQPEAPDAFAERLEAEQRLTHALTALAEPFRSTLMLRYYEDLEPAEIAARLRLPGGTVRWRLMRGLALLRERLDEAHGGDRRAWSLALVPLARLDGAAGLGAVTTAAVLPGVLAMNAVKLSAAAAALLVLALGLSLSGFLPESLSLASRRERPLEVVFRPLELETDEAPAMAAPSEVVPVTERVALATTGEPAPVEVAAAGEAALDARLFGHGRALSGARLVVSHAGERLESPPSGADGLATRTFALEERALVKIQLHAFGFASQEREAVCEPGRTTHLGLVELVPGGAVSGRIVDERGVGLADCIVTVGSLDMHYRELEMNRLEPPKSDGPRCTSDGNGHFRVNGLPAGMLRLWAHAEGRKAAYTPPLEVRAGQESTGVELVLVRLAPENLLHGIVLDPSGQPVPRAEIDFRHSYDGGNHVRGGSSEADAKGRFEFKLPEGALSRLTARDPAGLFASGTVEDVTNSEREVVIQLREVRRVELLIQSGGKAWLGAVALEVRSTDGETRLGGVERKEHPEGRCAFVVPDQPFVVSVQAQGHRALELGPFDPARVGPTLECTLEPVAGLHGIVLSGGAPAAGVRVRLQEEVPPDTELVANGYRLRIRPEAHDETRTDEEGRFVLTARAPGRYFVRAEPPAGAPAECGPVDVDESLGGAPLELHLGTGGAIEGRVQLAGGVDPEGAIVGITRGDGAERTLRVASDGHFRFEAVLPGDWRVELREQEVFGEPETISTTQGPGVQPYDLDANCTVHEGETSFVDVFDVAPGSLVLEGQLSIDERPANGWAVRLGPVGLLDFEGGGWRPLDSDGRFTLLASEAGEYRITLRLQGGAHQEQFLFDDVILEGDETWERALHTGKLRIDGIDPWQGGGPPRVVHLWTGPGQLLSVTVPSGSAGSAIAIDVPAGPGELRSPSESSREQDPDSWKLLRAIDVPRGGELRVELAPADVGGR